MLGIGRECRRGENVNISDPAIPVQLLPPGSRASIINDQKKSFQDLPAVITPRGQVISRWTPTPEERKRIADGEDLYLTLIASPRQNQTTGHIEMAINPVILQVGVCAWTK
jgi:hypothetical protein